MKNNCDCSSDYNIVSGNSLDLDVNFCESEIRADVVVSEYKSVRLWGRIINCEGEPVAGALIKLLKVHHKKDQVSYTGVAHTVSDCDGFYQFDLSAHPDECNHHHNPCYKILVSKAAIGPERTIPVNAGNCNVCEPCDYECECECECYEPVFEYEPAIINREEPVPNYGPVCKGDNNSNKPNYPKQSPRH